MAGGNLSPRQKMINMMYLVLTALLAMNVSKEILDSFVTVNNGLETTKLTLSEKMDDTYKQFQGLASENQEKYGAAWNDANRIQQASAELMAYIDNLKAMTIADTEGIPLDQVIAPNANGRDTVLSLRHVEAKDNYDKNTNLLVGSEPGSPKDGENSATELRQKLEAFRELVKSAVSGTNPTLAASADQVFDFRETVDASGTPQNWESMNFYHVPLAATTTIMSKIQADVRNVENEVVNYMMGNVESKTFKFNTLVPIVKPLSSYVTVGSDYKAEIFLGAYDNQNAPKVEIALAGATVDTTNLTINGPSEVLEVKNAKAQLKIPASGAGVRNVQGIITFKPVGGEEEKRFFSTTYEVAAPNLVVSPTAMNVFYRGVDNPVDISVSGYSAKDIAPSMTNGTLTKAATGYIVKPGRDNEALVGATVTNPDGTKKSMPGAKFRVKNVPNPTPYFAGKGVADETAKKSELTAAQGVIAKMENFEFDLKFNVVEFKLTMIVGGTPIEKLSKSAYLTEDMKTVLQKAKPGQKVYIEGIKAKGPDGTVRSLGSLAFKVV